MIYSNYKIKTYDRKRVKMNYDHPQLNPMLKRFRAPNPLPENPPETE